MYPYKARSIKEIMYLRWLFTIQQAWGMWPMANGDFLPCWRLTLTLNWFLWRTFWASICRNRLSNLVFVSEEDSKSIYCTAWFTDSELTISYGTIWVCWQNLNRAKIKSWRRLRVSYQDRANWANVASPLLYEQRGLTSFQHYYLTDPAKGLFFQRYFYRSGCVAKSSILHKME